MNIEIRPARADEMGQLGSLAAYVYAGTFGDGPVNVVSSSQRPEWTLCAFDGARMVSSFASFPFTMRAEGRAVAVAGISAVGTLPDYRRQGLLRRTMSRALTEMHERGTPLAALWASQAAIYQRYQFALGTGKRSYEIDTADLRFHDDDQERDQVRLEDLATAFETIRQVYQQFIEARIGYLHRARALWQASTLRDVPAEGPLFSAISHAGGRPTGYLVYTMRGARTSHLARNQELRIRELVALTPSAYRSLWRFLAGHDLVGRVLWNNAPVDDPAPDLLLEPRLLHARDQEGLWVRIVDVAGALAARGYSTAGRLSLAITPDPLTPWNEGVYELQTGPGGTEVRRLSTPGDLRCSLKALASLYMGYRSARHLKHAGLLEGSASSLAQADALFAPTHAPHCPDSF